MLTQKWFSVNTKKKRYLHKNGPSSVYLWALTNSLAQISRDFGFYGFAAEQRFYIHPNPNHNPEAIHNPSPKQSNSCLTSLSRDQNSCLPITLLVSRCDPHGRFTIVYRPEDTGGAAHSCAAGHTTCDKTLQGSIFTLRHAQETLLAEV